MHTFLSKTPPLRDYISKKKSLLNITEIANELPKLLLTNNVQNKINKLKVNELSVDILLKNKSEKEINLAMSHLSFIAHAFMWGGNKPEKILPEVISKPWVKLSKYLGRPPILSYASYCLDNWYKVNKKEPVSLDNVALINNFLGGVDEDWFVTIHVCIEDAAGDAIDAAYKLSRLNESNNVDDFNTNLKKILMSLKNVNNIFSKMPEKCDPYIYYHRVRPYIFGWKNNPALPDGLIYESCFNEEPQLFRGETGAQSSIVPTLDALLNVVHEKDELREYLDEMKSYMPPSHRDLIKYVEDHSKVKQEVADNKELMKLYDDCCQEISIFRSQHLRYAADYIHNQSTKSTLFGSGGSKVRGTGGTPFMKYLRKHRDETDSSKHKK
jgi:indoleamine 2,3-dioxygenase